MLYVHFTNHDYFAQDTFQDFDSALAYAKSKGFDATICKPYHSGKPHRGVEILASWSILGGLHDRRNAFDLDPIQRGRMERA